MSGQPACRTFKPAGIPGKALEEMGLTMEELEALRLADMEGLYHETAAQMMGVSRPTFGRILQEARRKVATALVAGMALNIEGGHYEMSETKHTCCGRGRRNRAENAAAEGCGCGGKGAGHHEGGECRNDGHEKGHGGGHGCCCAKGKETA